MTASGGWNVLKYSARLFTIKEECKVPQLMEHYQHLRKRVLNEGGRQSRALILFCSSDSRVHINNHDCWDQKHRSKLLGGTQVAGIIP